IAGVGDRADPVGARRGVGLDDVAVVGQAEVEVRRGGGAGAAHQPDGLAGGDDVADRHGGGMVAQVAVGRLPAVAVRDGDVVAPGAAVVAGDVGVGVVIDDLGDDAGGDGADGQAVALRLEVGPDEVQAVAAV